MTQVRPELRPERRRIVSPPDVLLQPSGDASPRTRLTGQRNLVDHRERTATDGDARTRNHTRPADRYLRKIHDAIFLRNVTDRDLPSPTVGCVTLQGGNCNFNLWTLGILNLLALRGPWGREWILESGN